jgi:Fic family protein
LYLVQQDLLPLPFLTLSGYFRKNLDQYFSLIQRVTQDRQWTDWVLFVLTGAHESSQYVLDMLRRMKKLKLNIELSSKNALGFYYKDDLLLFLWNHPYFTLERLTTMTQIAEKTANLLLLQLLATDLLSTRVIGDTVYFANHHLLEIVEGNSGGKVTC